MDLSQEQRIARHKSFLAANWDAIAAFSWEHYQQEGRGMVVVPEDDFVHFPTPTLKGLRFAFAAKGSDLLAKISAHFEDKEWTWLDSYDPDQRAIIIIVRDHGTSGYLIGGRTRPSEAWARQMAGKN